jgi:diguanylate cyclase (GGDEF)-like protein/PAS domain S-box-containing protein
MEETFYKRLLDNLMDGVYFVDTRKRITYWNGGAERISGFRAEETVGTTCGENILGHVDAEGRRLCESNCPLGETLQDGAARKADLFLHHRNGERVPVSVRISPIREGGEIVGAVETFSDNSAKLSALQRVERLMEENLKDPLTGVGNRRYTEMTLQSRFDEAQRFGWQFGILFIDIDHFKEINDTYGHLAGDEVLKEAAGTLTRNMRSFDFVGRWGGEEFIVIMANVDASGLQESGERMRMLIEEAWFRYDEETIAVTASVGGVIAEPGEGIEPLLARADAAMYRSKQSGRNCCTFLEHDPAGERGERTNDG